MQRLHPLRLKLIKQLRRRSLGDTAAVQGVGGKLKRRCLCIHAHLRHVSLLGLSIENCAGTAHHERRTLRLTGGVKSRIAQAQRLRRQGQAVVDERKLTPQLAVSRSAEVDVHFEQPAALIGRKHPRLALRLRQSGIGCAQHDKVLYISAAHTVKVARRDTVERRRYRADIVF